jgi:hypothetical protein
MFDKIKHGYCSVEYFRFGSRLNGFWVPSTGDCLPAFVPAQYLGRPKRASRNRPFFGLKFRLASSA